MSDKPTWPLLSSFPSTNGRIAASIVLAIITGIATVIRWTPPPTPWLLFLGAMMGIDTTQFAVKRWTHRPDGAGKPPAPTGGA